MQAIQEECITDANDQMIISIPVSFDGSWSKRGYTANHCVVVLIHDLKNIFAISQILTVLKHGDLQRIVEEKIKQ